MGPRLAAAVAIMAVLAVGVFFSGKLERDSRARVGTSSGEQVGADLVREDVAERKLEAKFDPDAFEVGVAEDAARFRLEAFEGKTLRAVQQHRVLIEDGVVLAPGQSWSASGIKVAVTAEKVSYQKLGATVSARHTIALISNVSEQPLAYYARLRSQDRGLCEVRGARMHNAMALMPGETAEVVVCGGAGKLRVDRLEILEISTLGYHYLSRVPPDAVGHDEITAGSHNPISRVPLCTPTTIDPKGTAGLIHQGLTRWVDVVDFYSRHSCERFRFFVDYRYEASERPLPARPPA